MHASETLPVAAIVADGASTIIRKPALATSHLHDYWLHSRQRLDRWSRAFASGDDASAEQVAQNERALFPVIEEILISEVLTRVWAAATVSHDAHHKSQSLAPVARSIFLGHQESRNRALLAILRMHESHPAEGRRLNVLRQKCERWTDMFLAYFPISPDIERMAFDVDRCKEFAYDITQDGPERETMQSLTMASLETTAKGSGRYDAANAELNSRIAAAVVGCLPEEAFDATGLCSLLWQSRIENTTNDTLGLVEQLLSLDSPCEVETT